MKGVHWFSLKKQDILEWDLMGEFKDFLIGNWLKELCFVSGLEVSGKRYLNYDKGDCEDEGSCHVDEASK